MSAMEATFCRCNVRVAPVVSAFSLVCLPTRVELDLLMLSSTLLPFPSINCEALLLCRLKQARALNADFTLSAVVVVHVASAPTADVGAHGALRPRLVIIPLVVLVTVTVHLLLKLEVVALNRSTRVPVVMVLMAPEVLSFLITAVVVTVPFGAPVAVRLILRNARIFGNPLKTLVMIQLMYNIAASDMESVIATH